MLSMERGIGSLDSCGARERERERGVLAYNLRESERWVGVD